MLRNSVWSILNSRVDELQLIPQRERRARSILRAAVSTTPSARIFSPF
jgi:hypothetical protein